MERKVMLMIFAVFAVVVTVVLCSILIDSGLAEEIDCDWLKEVDVP